MYHGDTRCTPRLSYSRPPVTQAFAIQRRRHRPATASRLGGVQRDQRAERRPRNRAVRILWKPFTPGNFARGVMRPARQGPLLAHVRLHTVQGKGHLSRVPIASSPPERTLLCRVSLVKSRAAPQYFPVIPFVLHRAATAPPPAMIRHLLSLAACMLLSSAVLRAQDTPAYTLSLAEPQADLPPEGQAMNGTMTRVKSTNNIVTREQFGDFELSLEWKQALGGNAGRFYRMTAVASVYGSSLSPRGACMPTAGGTARVWWPRGHT